MTEQEINKLKYYVCCPMCDLKKCLRGSDKCDAEQWAEEKMKEATNES